MPFRLPSNTPSSKDSIFPQYLFPSIPFRRRRRNPSTASTSSSSSSSSITPGTTTASFSSESPTSHPKSHPTNYLTGHTSLLRCARCATDLCLTSQVISKGFTGRHGRAYLVSGAPASSSYTSSFSSSSSYSSPTASLPNTVTGKPVPRTLVTGAHTVSDVSCIFCGNVLGWKYVAAEDESQRYKVGKFILETRKISSAVFWEAAPGHCDHSCGDEEQDEKKKGGAMSAGLGLGALGSTREEDDDDEVEFDSQDEDECEDLFAGIWNPTLARKRRKGRKFVGRGSRKDDVEDASGSGGSSGSEGYLA